MKLPADATIVQAATLAEQLPEAVAQAQAAAAGPDGTFSVDATGLTSYDSSTLALLMQARRLAQAAGLTFVVTGLPLQLCQLAALYGVDELLSATPACAATPPTAPVAGATAAV